MGLSVQSLLWDWNIEVRVKLHSDSSSAIAFGQRRGLGKQRHVQTRYLWIQERIAMKHIVLQKIKGEVNHADVLTKAMAGTTQDRHLKRMGYEFRSGAALKQKAVLA
jgi:hypothetical protein